MDESEEYWIGGEGDMNNSSICEYLGTDHIDVKIYMIGVFATLIAILSIIFNTFYTVVFIRNPSLRRSGVFYFGVIAVIDIIMAINYIAVMSLPVYMDFYHFLPLWHIFLSYFRIVLTESNIAMFASMLMIVLATTERFLKTFDGKTISVGRKFLERNRYGVSSCCLLIAFTYKLCSYYEIDYVVHRECAGDFAEYEIIAGPFAMNPDYRFYFMFLTRNILDRFTPFFALILMNILIIKAVKEEEQRKMQKESVVSNGKNVNLKTNRRNVRDATRALISLVSMYLLSQSLQVLLTFWETINRQSLESFPVMYSYLNDIVSIFTLLSSCLRFPVYFGCNRLIHTASIDTLHGMRITCFGESDKPREYSPIHRLPPKIESGSKTSISSPSAVYDENLEEWRL